MKKTALMLAACCMCTIFTACGKEISVDDITENDIENIIDNMDEDDIESAIEQGAAGLDDNIVSDGSDTTVNEQVTEADKAAAIYEDMFKYLPEIEVTPAEQFEYTIDNYGKAMIMNYTGSSPEVRIPDTIEGMKVTEVYLGNAIISELILPDTVERVKFNNKYLKYVNVPSAYEYVFGGMAISEQLYQATKLESVYLNDGVKRAPEFYGCTSLTAVRLPDTLEQLNTFERCSSLTEINLPESITTMYGRTFTETGIIEIVIPSGVTIYEAAFDNCVTLKKAVMSDGVKLNRTHTFYNCYSLAEVTLPNDMTEIPYCTFANCTSLSEIKLPESILVIGGSAFSNCTSLTNIVIPDNIMEIDTSAFEGCTNISATYKNNIYTYDNIYDLYTAING